MAYLYPLLSEVPGSGLASPLTYDVSSHIFKRASPVTKSGQLGVHLRDIFALFFPQSGSLHVAGLVLALGLKDELTLSRV